MYIILYNKFSSSINSLHIFHFKRFWKYLNGSIQNSEQIYIKVFVSHISLWDNTLYERHITCERCFIFHLIFIYFLYKNPKLYFLLVSCSQKFNGNFIKVSNFLLLRWLNGSSFYLNKNIIAYLAKYQKQIINLRVFKICCLLFLYIWVIDFFCG